MSEVNTPKRTPNAEQEKAIYHNGGKLLSAGAGSGKTFVLIEHLVFLLGQIQQKSSSADWSKLISSELSKIVLMTFTKKAAGEMSVRMMRRIEELLDLAVSTGGSTDLAFWTLVRQNLSSLNITTIHGFCHRLLRMGFWSNFPAEINLISALEHKDKIQKLFDKWFLENQNDLDPIFQASSQSLLVAMIEIFSSPELRVLWMNPMKMRTANEEINQFLTQFAEVKGYRDLFVKSFDLQTSEKEKSKKWYELLFQFSELKTEYGIVSAENYGVYNEFFKGIARFPVTSSKEISPHQKEILLRIRELKDDLKDLNEDLKALVDNFETYQKWVSTITDLFKFIDSHYFDVDGFSFADLEYYVLKGLEAPEALAKVQESFSYFIVDEFQDTSYIQFSILKYLIGGRSEKLFCVGDKKQAIYGFRGGELQVFSDCAELLGPENNYYLKNNFRSFSSIIAYNNSLFERVFPLGLKFEGDDPHGVEMEAQTIPVQLLSGPNTIGKVVCLKTEVKGDASEFDLDYLESIKLNEQIKLLLESDDYHSICVLYRKLKPSGQLLEHLLSSEVSFSAQIKIQFSDDPIINLFLYLVEWNLNSLDEKKNKSTFILIQTLLKILGVPDLDPSHLAQYLVDQKTLGLRLAFHKFVFTLGLTNSFHAQNAELVDAICRLTKEEMVKIYNLLKNDEGEDYACEMMNGEAGTNGKKRIVIMSAHASKGLEFDAVLLGGVHTNGRYNGMKDHIGKFPHSFKWKKALNQKRFFKSPFYHLESEILTLKDFSESKRLLYVACTRAVKYLAYVDLWSVVKDVPKDLHLYDNSWIQALRLVPPEITLVSELANSAHERLEISLIQRDQLGVVVQSQKKSLGLISELSVTRLASIADCPFKFYLQNICKIEPDKSLQSFSSQVNANSRTDEFEVENEDEGEVVFYSSKKRGTEVHHLLSKLYLQEMQLNQVPSEEIIKVKWAYDLSRDFQDNCEIISEKMIKFSFFGVMISGTPDLVFVNKLKEGQKKIVVWDFKTGLRHPESEASYWFQLKCYAFAYAKLNHLGPDKKMEISLLYLDQQEIVTEVFSVDEITQDLFGFWKKTESLDQVNSKHCSLCDYSNICQKGHC